MNIHSLHVRIVQRWPTHAPELFLLDGGRWLRQEQGSHGMENLHEITRAEARAWFARHRISPPADLRAGPTDSDDQD
jgi:hypothetical protein